MIINTHVPPPSAIPSRSSTLHASAASASAAVCKSPSHSSVGIRLSVSAAMSMLCSVRSSRGSLMRANSMYVNTCCVVHSVGRCTGGWYCKVLSVYNHPRQHTCVFSIHAQHRSIDGGIGRAHHSQHCIVQHLKGGPCSRGVGIQQQQQAVGENDGEHLHHVFGNLSTVGGLDQQLLVGGVHIWSTYKVVSFTTPTQPIPMRCCHRCRLPGHPPHCLPAP